MSGRRDVVLEREDLELKIASRQLIRAAGGTDGAGETVGSRQQRMSDCQLPNTGDFLTIQEVRKLQEVTVGAPGWPHVTRALAKQDGFALVRLPQAPERAIEWHQALGEVSSEVGESVQLVCKALGGDGKVTACEVREHRIMENIDEAIEQLFALRALAAAAPEKGER